jgi:hypothetical protein
LKIGVPVDIGLAAGRVNYDVRMMTVTRNGPLISEDRYGQAVIFHCGD